jgi:hypothetical protein
VPDFLFFLVVFLLPSMAPVSQQNFDLWSSCCLLLPSSCHLGSFIFLLDESIYWLFMSISVCFMKLSTPKWGSCKFTAVITFYVLLGIKTTSLHLLGKHSATWALQKIFVLILFFRHV